MNIRIFVKYLIKTFHAVENKLAIKIKLLRFKHLATLTTTGDTLTTTGTTLTTIGTTLTDTK